VKDALINRSKHTLDKPSTRFSLEKTVDPEVSTQLTSSGVAVEKLAFQKAAKIRSRQDALQAICRGRLDIFHPRN
jgi:hypothetical protein